MKKVVYMHTGSGNHGCEAIIRTTAKLLDAPRDVVLWTGTKSEDVQYGSADKFERIVVSEELKKYSLPYFEAQVRRRIFREKDANMQVFLRELFKDNIAISVGGDSYCYPYSAKQNVEFGKIICKYCKASVLWGCSINEDAITPEVREDLAGYDLITARECLTYELLKEINPNTVKVADPAFLLDRVDLPLPEGFLEGNTVGINVSPMIMDYGSDSVILKNYENLIQYILDETQMDICLIPHVVWTYNDDRKPINYLFEKFATTGRVCKIEDGNATELKGYIARCRFFVGARTHATIAAYSTGVPTLVVGYSIKSRGIAKDLFGTDENYVLPVQNLKAENELREAFAWIQRNEDPIRKHLETVIPDYKKEAARAREYFEQVCNK